MQISSSSKLITVRTHQPIRAGSMKSRQTDNAATSRRPTSAAAASRLAAPVRRIHHKAEAMIVIICANRDLFPLRAHLLRAFELNRSL